MATQAAQWVSEDYDFLFRLVSSHFATVYCCGAAQAETARLGTRRDTGGRLAAVSPLLCGMH